jgi:ABC-type branched-subunit amino acid transport system ATPase component
VSDFVIETKCLTRRFGGVTAVRDVALQVRRGERRALLGPNGAGKQVEQG